MISCGERHKTTKKIAQISENIFIGLDEHVISELSTSKTELKEKIQHHRPTDGNQWRLKCPLDPTEMPLGSLVTYVLMNYRSTYFQKKNTCYVDYEHSGQRHCSSIFFHFLCLVCRKYSTYIYQTNRQEIVLMNINICHFLHW